MSAAERISIENILKAKIHKVIDSSDSKVKAIASVTINGFFAVHGLKVIESDKGTFVAMPNTRYGDKYQDTFHAVTAEARQTLIDTVLKAYNQKLSQSDS